MSNINNNLNIEDVVSGIWGKMKGYYSGAIRDDVTDLETNDKTIVGAINELRDYVINESTPVVTSSDGGIFKGGQVLTKFAIFSDIHLSSPYDHPYVDDSSDENKGYKANRGYIKGDLAINVLSSMSDLDFVAFNGDCLLESSNSSDTTFAALSTIFDDYRTELGDTPLYMIPGNHDMGTEVSTWNNITKSSTWSGVTFLDSVTSKTCFYKEINGDLFIWFGILNSPAFNYTQEMYDWLFNLLNANRSRKRIFLFTHWFDGSVDEFGWRALEGEHYNNGWATSDASHATRGPFGQIKNYKNVIWFTGHAHTDWELEDTYPTIKVHANNTARMVSIPSVYTNGELAIVTVYDNMVVVQPYKKNAVVMPEKIYFIGNYQDGSGPNSFSVTNNLTGVISSNPDLSVLAGSSYTATLTLDTDYENMQVTVVMGETDITSTAYSNGTITISEVTGNLVITATASEIIYYTITQNLTNVSTSNNVSRAQAGTGFYTTLTAINGNTSMRIVIMHGGRLIWQGNAGATKNVTISSVDGNIVITAIAPIPSDPDWEALDSDHPDYVKLIYNINDISSPTPILADGSQSGQSAYNTNYIADLIIDGTQVTPANTFQFLYTGKHEVLMKFSDNKFHTGFCYKVQDLWSISVPSSVTNSSASILKGCTNLKYVKLDMALSGGSLVDNALDAVPSLEVVKFGSNIGGADGEGFLSNAPSLTDIYINSDTFQVQYPIGSTSISNSYTVHVNSNLDQSTISSSFPNGTIVADIN